MPDTSSLDLVTRDYILELESRKSTKDAIDRESWEVTFAEVIVSYKLDFFGGGVQGTNDVNRMLSVLYEARHGGRRVPVLLNFNSQRSWSGATIDEKSPSRPSATIVLHDECAACGSREHKRCGRPLGTYYPPGADAPISAPETRQYVTVSVPPVPRGLGQAFAIVWLLRMWQDFFDALEMVRDESGMPVILRDLDGKQVRLDLLIRDGLTLGPGFVSEKSVGEPPASFPLLRIARKR